MSEPAGQPADVTWTVPGPRLLSDAEVVAVARAALEHGGRPGLHLAVVFVSDRELARLHDESLGDPSPTDVLAFPMTDGTPEQQGLLGDVVISLETAKRQADARRRSLAEEVRFLLAHGLLHLVGYDHATPTEKREMVGMTRRLVRAAPLPEPALRRPNRARKLAKGSKK